MLGGPQYLKNIIVQYMLAAEPDDQRRMLPAVATMLGFTCVAALVVCPSDTPATRPWSHLWWCDGWLSTWCSNAERAKVMKHIQAAEASGVTGVIGRAATGIFSVFGSS